MIDDAEAVTWARTFGVDITQVRRDHLISHILAALPTISGWRMRHSSAERRCAGHISIVCAYRKTWTCLCRMLTRPAGALTRALGRLLRCEYPDVAVGSPTPARVDARCNSPRPKRHPSKSN